jgi:hypothetical protein
MNEHIEAYLKQHHCRDYFNTYGETIEDDHYFMYREEVEGLIELIVRECIGIVDSHRTKMDSRPRHIIEDLKNHFGVEE